MPNHKLSSQQKLSHFLTLTAVAVTLVLVFAASALAQTETVLYGFSSSPSGGVAIDKNGNLFGASPYGGANQKGTVYKLSQVSGEWQQTVLYNFTGKNDGAQPCSPVLLDAAGNLYGTAELGGALGFGLVYKLSPTSSGEWKESVLYAFSNKADGAYPYTGNLVFDKAGNLYGSTVGGGDVADCSNTGGCGVMFRLSPAAGKWKFGLLHTFNGSTDGAGPANFTFDAKGNLYGSAPGQWQGFELPAAPGLVFQMVSMPGGGWREQPIYEFQGGPDGGLPGPIILDAAGNIYGAGADGGIGPNCLSGYQTNMGCGVVFKLSRASGGTWSEKTLYAFTGGADGSGPDGGIVFDGGKIYGTTLKGGAGSGTVFELTPGSGAWTESVAHTFSGSADGALPEYSLVKDQAGNLFGTTFYGGSPGNGVVFEITP